MPKGTPSVRAPIAAAPSNRLREWRVAAGLSQEALAERVGTTGVSVGRYETGQRSLTIEMLEQFAAALECRPADLLPDPESALDDRERALLKGFKALAPGHQDTLLDLTAALDLQERLRAEAEAAARPPPRPPKLARRYN
ncbi:MAG: helix-turn-helix domain-containing protein [Rhodospirillales bacterium]|nr:helix-turn-helix domain-containing protein [Rhodospirillales bacterium]MDH3912420.1 helix-turn-helix domain-containing protein [Rhodospirillales bacterium]